MRSNKLLMVTGALTVAIAFASVRPAVAADDEIQQLKSQLAAQQFQIEQLRQALEKLKAPPVQPVADAVRPAEETGAASALPPSATGAAENEMPKPSPLSFQIGDTYITPVGFMDATYVFRSTNTGSGIGSNFNSIPFANVPQGHLSESLLSTQNSRIGARFDTKVLGARVLGYWESDFLGNAPANLVVGSNANTFRMRLFWVQVTKSRWEVLGGQSWSLMTPNRQGISPLPSDLFYSDDTDTNYQMGLTWARQTGFRVVWHPTNRIAWAFAAENPRQYIGSDVTLPSNLSNAYSNLLNNGGTSTSVPNRAPDFISKIAFDPQLGSHAVHFEITGLLSSYKLYNSLTSQSFTREAGGVEVNSNVALTGKLRFVENLYYTNGGGRYIFGQGPDLIVNGDGGIGLVRAASTVDGFELQATRNLLFYAYYGGGYFAKAVVTDPSSGKPVGYGYPGSSNSNNRAIQEISFGVQNTFWRDARWGQLRLDLQYANVFRSPWSATAGAPSNAVGNMVFVNLRYALPGAAPNVE